MFKAMKLAECFNGTTKTFKKIHLTDPKLLNARAYNIQNNISEHSHVNALYINMSAGGKC